MPEGPIRKAVFPVAGLGTRFLPATKAIPKEMLPVVDRPLIQHVVDEAREAGIAHFVFVTGRNKHVIEDHFDVQYELETVLEHRGKTIALDALKKMRPEPGQSSFTRQQEPKGLGHAVWCARELVGREPFALLLPDVLVEAPAEGGLAQMTAEYARLKDRLGADAKINLIAVERIDPQETEKYGIVAVGARENGICPITDMVEKPRPADAPSDLMIMGRYILQPEIFEILATQREGAGNEIQLTDAMRTLMQTQPFFAFEFRGRSHDCGSKLGFLEANLAFALADPELKAPVSELILKFAEQVRRGESRAAYEVAE